MKTFGANFFLLASILSLTSGQEPKYDDLLGVAVGALRPNRIQGFRVRMSDIPIATTIGSLRFGVRQGPAQCETAENTVQEPESAKVYEVTDKSLFGSCQSTDFVARSLVPIKVRVLSTSRNDAYVDKVEVKIAGEWRNWEGKEVPVERNRPSDWRKTFVSDIEDGVLIRGFAITISDHKPAATKGNLRIGVRQGSHTSCETDIDLVVDPKRGVRYVLTDKDKFGTCGDTKFNPDYRKPIQIRVLSEKCRNSAFFDEVKLKIGGKWRGWAGLWEEVSNGNPSPWEAVE